MIVDNPSKCPAGTYVRKRPVFPWSKGGRKPGYVCAKKAPWMK